MIIFLDHITNIINNICIMAKIIRYSKVLYLKKRYFDNEILVNSNTFDSLIIVLILQHLIYIYIY